MPTVGAGRGARASAGRGAASARPAEAKRGAAKRAPAPLSPFAAWYDEAQRPPQIPVGGRVAGFDAREARAIHALYWSLPDSASFDDLVAAVQGDPAFRRSDAKVDKGTLAKLFSKMPDSFPWGWRSRALAAASRTFVEALLQAPVGTPAAQVHAALARRDPDFPTISSFKLAAKDSWRKDPARFPFVALLPKAKDGGAVLEAQGPKDEDAFERNPSGSLRITEHNLEKLRPILLSDEIRYGWGVDELNAFVNEKIGGGVEKNTLRQFRDDFKGRLPSLDDVMKPAAERLARRVRALFDEGLQTPGEVLDALHERDGHPRWTKKVLDTLRGQFPDVVPDFRAAKDAPSRAEARKLLEAIRKDPYAAYVDVGRALGFSTERTHDLVEHIRRNDLGELESRAKGAPYTEADKAVLRKIVDGAPLGATFHDLLQALEREDPGFLARHPYAHPNSLGQAIRDVLGVTDWRTVQNQRWSKRFADHARRSPPGTQFEDIVRFLQDEYEGAYGRIQAQKIAKRWDDEPALFPEIQALRDAEGVLPWQRSRVRPTKELALRVAKAIEAHKAGGTVAVVKALHEDPAFRARYPTFNHEHVHVLRAQFPTIVPFIDELSMHNRDVQAAAAKRHADIAKRIERYAEKHEAPAERKAAVIARALGVSDRQVLAALRAHPEKFPWWQDRPIGNFDLYLATRVAYAIENMAPGASRQQIVDELRKDERFRARYPLFKHDHNLDSLQRAYPDIVPAFAEAQAQLRMKTLVDAVLAADKGAPLRDVVRDVRARHPGVYSYFWEREGFVASMIDEDPARFPYADALRSRSGALSLHGRGLPPQRQDESNAQLAARLGKLERIPERLPLLDEIGKLGSGATFRGFEVLAIQHMLGSQVALFDKLRQLGLSTDRASVVAIPYSTSKPVVEAMQDKGWDVRVPPLDLDVWYEMVKDAMVERIAAAEESGRKVLVLDDGGLVAMVLEKHPELKRHAHLLKVVEQTRRGITVADGVELQNPVVNVAQSWGKFVEGPLIGTSLTTNALERLARIGVEDLKGKKVGVVGYGTIGAPLARFLKEQGAEVTVLDVSEEAMAEARADGLKTPKDRKAFFSSQDIVLGATGVRSMTPEDLDCLKDGAIIGSGSSKLVEIDVEHLKAGAGRKGAVVIDDESHPPTVKYRLKDGREISLLAKGFPLNFDGDVEDIEAEKIQLTRGLMLIGALQAAGASVSGVNALDPKLQLALLAAFDEVGGTEKGGEPVKKAQRLAELRLSKLSEDRRALQHSRRHGG